ncbi:radical SAM protein [Serpentinicella alkaliphila]|uniref:Radical SAM family protein n=1 Tax=Serpentinicella alkaliphila TaxID=1734049 RepID=A0A4R2TXX8_9FIRM|nr:radical SAM protein [Serpentinicella alkaliphila]QUH26712.1 radical SAM protein [Serpentinicella alkaliphila]TCQ07927.1 radical SAM family protein [Serpentinicella alkaliphila]
MNNQTEVYEGYEVGPIRPPSEAQSLMIRISRNCPWNNCKFCGLYKGTKFSIRPKEHVIEDINQIKRFIDIVRETETLSDSDSSKKLAEINSSLGESERIAFYSAVGWYRVGMESIFLQDANSLIIKPDDLVEILEHIKACFPEVQRITSYARSHTIARISDEDLLRFANAGLNRIHIGMESASDEILKLIKKGVDKETHIKAGKKVKKAGIQLSEYFMPGLGGNEYSRENAIETADALNQINPDFIRIRTLAIPDNVELFKDYEQGIFTRTNDVKIVEELLLFTEKLEGITSTIKSDHILNLVMEYEGQLPQDKDKMISALQWFLNLNENEKMVFMVGRRTGIMNYMYDLVNSNKRERVLNIIKDNNITTQNVDEVVWELMKRFI